MPNIFTSCRNASSTEIQCPSNIIYFWIIFFESCCYFNIRPDSFISTEADEEKEIDVKKVVQWVINRKNEGQLTNIHIFHDEMIIYKSEQRKAGWISLQVHPFLPKSEGVGFNVSDFICEIDGPLRNEEGSTRLIDEIGKQNTDKATIKTKGTADALNVKLINEKSGGKQPIMKDGWYNQGYEKKIQQMYFMESRRKVTGKLTLVLVENIFVWKL